MLLACALAQKDDLGTFAAVDVREPFRKIMNDQKYDIEHILPTLNKLYERETLIKSGSPRNFRYKFRDALLQPYVVMQGVKQGYSQEVLDLG